MKPIFSLHTLMLAASVVVASAHFASAHVPAPPPALFILYFDADSSELNEQAKLVVASAADLTLQRYPTVEITGHADASERSPVLLAHRRADAVRQAMIVAGVTEDRISLGTEEVGTLKIGDGLGDRLVTINLCHKHLRCRG